VRRAKIVLGCLEGKKVKDIVKELNGLSNSVILWRERFLKDGVQGLYDHKRTGKPITYGNEFREQVLKTLGTTPPNGLARWDGPNSCTYEP
jgi:transposase